MLPNWLDATDRPETEWLFSVVDVLPTEAPDEDEVAHLAELLEEARIRPDVRDRLLGRAGWAAFDERVGRHPTLSGQRGEWGEAFLYGVLEEIRDLIVPVKKLRFKLARGQFQPGTDIVAIQMEEESISRVAFLESKLSTVVDNSLAHEAYTQLLDDSRLHFADILAFMDEVLAESETPIAAAFRDYLASRQARPAEETFHVALVYDEEAWREQCLTNLGDEDVELEPLEVLACRLTKLGDLVDTCYANVSFPAEGNGIGE